MPTLHLAQAHAAGGGMSYLYELAYPAPAAPELGACHALDVPLVFGAVLGAQREGIVEMLVGSSPPQSFISLGELMRSEWAAFARTGSPGWLPYTAMRRTTRVYDALALAGPYPEETSMHLWERHVFDALPLL
jgi:para-nitrobenzyl esterase